MTASLNRIHQLLLQKGMAFVRYSLPESTESTTLISYHPQSFQDLNTLANTEEEGFVFAPFVADKAFPVWYYKTDDILNESTDNQNIIDYLSGLADRKKRSPVYPESTPKSEYYSAFNTYLFALNSGRLDKAILSKIVTHPKSKTSPLAIYTKLVETYPTAFVYMINLPSGELWMGATPERLIEQDKQGIKTMALAGTQQLDSRKVKAIVWKKRK